MNPPIRGGLCSYAPLQGLQPQALDTFGWNIPSQLVIGYHWLTFLNQVRNASVQELVQVKNIWPHIS